MNIKRGSRLSFGEIPSKIQEETCRPRVIRIIRRLSVTLDVVLSGFNGRTWEDGGREWCCAEDKLIRFCLLIYPLVHAPRTNERGKAKERGQRKSEEDAMRRCGRWQTRAFPSPPGAIQVPVPLAARKVGSP